MVSQWLIDGQPTNTCAVDDRGLAYGDGVFRTLRVIGDAPEAWRVHVERLSEDCQRLGLICPAIDELWHDAQQLISDRDEPQNGAVLKIVVTRGSGGRGYGPASANQPRRIVSIHDLPAHALSEPAPLSLPWSGVVLACQPLLAGIKHLNRLEQVLARAECERHGHADAAMRDSDGWLISTTMRNLLLRRPDGAWCTPSLDQAGIKGATRQRLIQALGADQREVYECRLNDDDLSRFDAVVACNSVGGIAAVLCLGDTVFDDSLAAAKRCRFLLQNR